MKARKRSRWRFQTWQFSATKTQDDWWQCKCMPLVASTLMSLMDDGREPQQLRKIIKANSVHWQFAVKELTALRWWINLINQIPIFPKTIAPEITSQSRHENTIASGVYVIHPSINQLLEQWPLGNWPGQARPMHLITSPTLNGDLMG